jgi:glycosyltransferase involved in cell wall biosynthesis
MGTKDRTNRRNRDIDGEITTSVVLPAYNEVGNVEPLVEELTEVFVGKDDLRPVEILLVDDGSTDGTRNLLLDLADVYDEVIAVLLRRNFGQSAALAAGIDRTCGEWVVTMDADGQNDPADILKLIETLKKGYDCVSGWRKERHDPLSKRLPSTIQTKMAMWTGPNIHDFGCTLKAYRGDALREIDLYGEGHRYIPSMLHKRGNRITEQVVNHRPRTHGETKYGAKRLVRGFVDLLFQVFWNRYSTRPLHFLGGTGIALTGIGGLIGIHSVFLKYVLGQALLPKLPRLLLTVVLILFGLQLITFGFLAEVLTKLFYREKTPYNVESVVGAE